MTMATTFQICTFNCNGLGKFSKRKDVFEYLRKLKHDIYFLQETHWKTDSENFIRSGWGYNCFVAGNSTNKNGVAILFNNSFEYKLFNTIKDADGCYLILDIEILGERYTMANIYGPSNSDRPDFFYSIFQIVEQMENDNIIIGGDWNVILNPRIDSRNYSSFVNRPQSRKKIIEMMNRYDMIDVWRELFPTKKSYTWRRFNSIQQSR